MDTPAKNAWKKAYLSTVGTSSPKIPDKGNSVLYVSRRLSCASQGFEITSKVLLWNRPVVVSTEDIGKSQQNSNFRF